MTETGAMHLLKLIACECQVYGVAPMSLFVGKGWLVTLCSLVMLLPRVCLGVPFQSPRFMACVVSAATLVRLLPSVGVGMPLQITSCSA